jgi:hypothetical protein
MGNTFRKAIDHLFGSREMRVSAPATQNFDYFVDPPSPRRFLPRPALRSVKFNKPRYVLQAIQEPRIVCLHYGFCSLCSGKSREIWSEQSVPQRLTCAAQQQPPRL